MAYDPTQAGPTSYSGNSTGGGPNFLGGGMYSAAPITIDNGAFNNAVGAQAGNQLGGQLNNYLGATTAPAATGPTGDYSTGIQGQQALANQYGQMAAGQGPSAATVAAQQEGAANLAASESMLGSARGAGNPAAAQLAARNAQTTGGQQVAQNAVAGRTQEELGALGAQAGLYGNIGAQGLQEQGLIQANNQNNQANNLAANTNYLNSLSGINSQQQQGQIAAQQLDANTQLQQQQQAQNAYNQSAANNNKIFGQVLNAGTQAVSGAAGMFF